MRQNDMTHIGRRSSKRRHGIEDLADAARKPRVEHREAVLRVENVDVHQTRDQMQVFGEVLHGHYGVLP